jgi:hypothetical protein
MNSVDYLSLLFAFAAFVAAVGFFWCRRNVAGFAFMAALIIVLAGLLQQRVVFSSGVIGLVVEKSGVLPR